MRAVVSKGAYAIEVEDRPKPQIIEPEDVIIEVTTSALCGSDLAIYHGAMPFKTWDFIVGHEAVGIVVEAGAKVTKFKKGDRVVSAFATCCQNSCFYCLRGLTCRCESSKTFGVPALDGMQAEFARIPSADGTLLKAPDDLADEHLILLCDILPTGYNVVKTAIEMMPEKARQHDLSIAILGLGPVGLLGVLAAKRKFKTVFAIDSVPDRLAQAERYGAVAIKLDDDTVANVKKVTEGRGTDAVGEIVGSPQALDLALKLVRIGGVVSVGGLHTKELSLQGLELYSKNISLRFGRTPVVDLWPECLGLLRELIQQGVMKDFVQHSVELDQAKEYYDLFDKRKVGKTVLQRKKAS